MSIANSFADLDFDRHVTVGLGRGKYAVGRFNESAFWRGTGNRYIYDLVTKPTTLRRAGAALKKLCAEESGALQGSVSGAPLRTEGGGS